MQETEEVGVLLYVRDSITATEFHVDSEFGDHVWCLIGDLLVGIIYRSINSQIVGLDSNKNLLKLMREVSSKHVLILGDFNYPEIDWSTYSALPSASQDCCEFISTVEDCFFYQHVTMPTRGAPILDLVLSKEPDLVSNVQIISSLGRSQTCNKSSNSQFQVQVPYPQVQVQVHLKRASPSPSPSPKSKSKSSRKK